MDEEKRDDRVYTRSPFDTPVQTQSDEKNDSGTLTPKSDDVPVTEIEFPEGGLTAWLNVFGSLLLTLSTFGLVNAWVFQEYYSSTLLRDTPPATIAWIGSVQYSLVLAPGLISGRLFDIGHFHVPMISATALLIVSLFLVAECKEFWQFMLGQGLALGLACGFLFGPALAVVSHYFHRKRAIAYSVVALGSSIGGTVLPIAVRKLLPRVGFPWTMRIIAFILLVTTGTSNLIMRRRLPPKNVKGGLFNFPAFKNKIFSLFTASICIGFLGMYTVLTYIDVAAVATGIDDDLAFYLVSIGNAGSFFGRLASGWLSARYGPFNVLIPFSLVAAAMTYAWPHCTSIGAIVPVAIIYGIASGAFVGLIATPLGHPKFGGQGDIGRRQGMMFTISAIGALCGPPISGAIHDNIGGYGAVGAYAGSMIILSVLLMIAARWVALGQWRGNF